MSLSCALATVFASCFAIAALAKPSAPEFSTASRSEAGQITSLRVSEDLERVRVVSFEKDEDRMPIMIWASNGSVLMKGALDYRGHALKDCDMQTSKLTVGQFEDRFDKEIADRDTQESTSVPHSHKTFKNFREIAAACAEHHEKLMQKVRTAARRSKNSKTGKSRRKRDLSKWIWPGTKWCGYGDISEGETDYGIHHQIDQCCQEHDRCPEAITAFETK